MSDSRGPFCTCFTCGVFKNLKVLYFIQKKYVERISEDSSLQQICGISAQGWCAYGYIFIGRSLITSYENGTS